MMRILGFCLALAFGANAFGAVILEDDFSKRRFPAHWSRSLKPVEKMPFASALVISTVPRSSGSGVAQGTWSSERFEAGDSKYIEIDYYFKPGSKAARYALCVDGANGKPLITALQDGSVYKFSNGAAFAPVVPARMGEWRHIRYRINQAAKTYDLYIDDMNRPKATQMALRNPNGGKAARVYSFGSETEPSESWFGPVRVSGSDDEMTLQSSRSDNAQLLRHWSFDSIEQNTLPEAVAKNAIRLGGTFSERNLEPGLYGKAFRFESGRCRTEVADSPELTLQDDFTLESTFRPDAVDSYRTILWKGDRSRTPEAINYHFGIRDGNLELKYKNRAGEWIIHSTSGKPVRAGEWYRCAALFRDGNCMFLLNGAIMPSASQKTGAEDCMIGNDAPAQVGIGTAGRNPGAYFNGLIDDLKIWRGQVIDIDDCAPDKWRALLERREQEQRESEARRKEEAAAAETLRKRDYSTFWAKHRNKDQLGVLALEDARRLNGSPEFFRTLEKAGRREANVSAARNEYEGGQLIFFGAPGTRSAVDSVTVSELVSASGARIPASAITLGRVGRVKAEQSGIAVEFSGWIPDPIFTGETAVEIAPEEFGAVHYRIFTGDAAPGRYQGAFRIKSGGEEITVPLSCEVFGFELPRRSSLKSIFSFDEEAYRKWYKLDSVPLDAKRRIHNFLLDYRITGAELYGHSVSPDPALLPELRDRLTSVTLPVWSSIPLDAYEPLVEQLKTLGVSDLVYFYGYDELSCFPEKYAQARKDMEAVKAKYPTLKRMQTSMPEPALQGMFEVWVPLFNHFGKETERRELERLMNQGVEVWWYPADSPEKPFANIFLDFPVFDCRILGTLSYLHGVDGLLHWRVNREWLSNLERAPEWSEESWRAYIYHFKTGTRTNRNGMGNFVYPGRHGELLPSLRLENLRDGFEDYEYLATLKRLCAEYRKRNGEDAEWKKAERLLQVPAEVAVAINNYTADPANLIQYREKLARAIETLTLGMEKK